MTQHNVFIVGATGETGKHILNALVDDASINITCFVRTSSEGKPATQQLKDRGLKVVYGNLHGPLSDLSALLKDIDTVISCVAPPAIKDQIPLVDAAVEAGVKRFLPCNWGTPSARGGILALRDAKEEVHDHIFRQKLGYTIIDIGFWFQASIPRVPSGKFDKAIFMPINELYAGGMRPNMLTDARDAGAITVKMIKDERTMNKRVIAYGEVLSQNEIHKIIEDKTGETLELTQVAEDEARATLQARKEAFAANPTDISNRYRMAAAQYAITKYVRGDNTPEYAEYLGYVNANKLFPDFKYRSYADFVDELIAGEVERPYPLVKLGA